MDNPACIMVTRRFFQEPHLMRKFALVLLAAAGICGPIAANADVMQNTPPVISVSGASDIPSDLSYQLAHINGAITNLQQQVQSIRQQTAMLNQAPSPLYPDSIGG
jgi:hypothetical protein